MTRKILLLLALGSIGAYAADLDDLRSDTRSELPYDPSHFYTEQMINIAKYGLPKCLYCQKIAIVGAGERNTVLQRCANRSMFVFLKGVSGLISAIELSRAGHTVTVFEASARCGGRILTVRDESKGLYH